MIYPDGSGRPFAPAEEGRRVVPIEHDGREIAALDYDAALDDDPELVEAVTAAATIALENELLHEESATRLAELQASRERIVTAGDTERRRLERNLHDGAQQRLVALAMQLRLIEHQIHDDPAAAERLVKSASEELALSIGRAARARARHPPGRARSWARAGAANARRAGDRSRPACRYEDPQRLPETVEIAAYFVASEALANVAKYAQAKTAAVQRDAHERHRGGRDLRRRHRRRRRVARLGPARARRSRRGARRPAARAEPTRARHDRQGGAAVRVVIADDSLLVREGIASLLRRAGFDVVAEADDGDQLVAAVDEHVPDAVVVDVRMPPTHTEEGLEAARAIRSRHPRVGILILSQQVEVGLAMRALVENPQGLGYLLKERVTDIEDFARTLRHVAAGGSALDPQIVSSLLADPRGDGPLSTLTPREHEVLELVAEGRTNKAIADRMGVSQRAVTKHVTSIFSKLDLPPGEDDHRRILAVLTFLRR